MESSMADKIRRVIERHVELWNAGKKEEFIENWKSLAPGEVT